MLFTTHQFLLVFLPIVYLIFYLVRTKTAFHAASFWMLIASFAFYFFWDFWDLLPLSFSILINYVFYTRIRKSKRKSYLILGIVFNLLFLAYFKYLEFILKNLSFDTSDIGSQTIPLGISFYTFTQIAFLVDSYHVMNTNTNLLNYSLFVSYFPHLVCGPIINFTNFHPQLTDPNKFISSSRNTCLFILCFSIGLFKKLVLADPLGNLATQLFDVVPNPSFGLQSAWVGTTSYTLQLYFDFSGYSDMAVGISHLFGLKIPDNFNAPYQATSIIDFWRRWHMSLSEFLRNYVYIPLGGSRSSRILKYRNLILTMLLGGLWHGASWLYIAWGGYHGILLTLNHFIRSTFFQVPLSPPFRVILNATKKGFLFFLVAVGWVLFRSPNFESASNIYRGLFGIDDGPEIALNTYLKGILFISLLVAFVCPDTLSLREKFERSLDEKAAVKLLVFNLSCVSLFILGFLSISQMKHFLYAGF